MAFVRSRARLRDRQQAYADRGGMAGLVDYIVGKQWPELDGRVLLSVRDQAHAQAALCPLSVLIAAVVVPGLEGMIYDRLSKSRPLWNAHRSFRRSGPRKVDAQSVDQTMADLTQDWLKLRDHSVVLRRQCKEDTEHGEAAIQEDDRGGDHWRLSRAIIFGGQTMKKGRPE